MGILSHQTDKNQVKTAIFCVMLATLWLTGALFVRIVLFWVCIIQNKQILTFYKI